ncbi:gliding motility protein GldL [Alloprevotella sp. Lung230]|uniref:type IX secretion system motor protein PorL/GldL n=1 Tax=Alloprevotella sp. Lung230 TaxID=2766595 RepID=UPI001656362A|nr:gliding motility protein GldL [Alloprevotella sp. Lung230]MBC8626918.1 gliding motility protein GldL [Alloprevotella sp. Lung230]
MSKLNIVVRLQHWMDSVPGQTFLNYAYSWGAAIVILGALFKLTHLPGGNFMLFIGMGTEAVVFFLAAFDRPFDKQEIDKELAHDFESDEEIERAEGWEATSDLADQEASETIASETATLETAPKVTSVAADAVQSQTAPTATSVVGGGIVGASGTVIVVGGGTSASPSSISPTPAASPTAEIGTPVAPLQTAVSAHFDSPEGTATVEKEADKLATIIRLANDELLRRAQAVLSPEMEAATQDYIEKLRTLNETLSKVDEQSARLTRDSQEMENLNRTLIGINKVYDLHFASISRQVTTIEDINAQTQQLAAKIEEVNRIYARMMQTLNVMGNPMAAASASDSAASGTQE